MVVNTLDFVRQAEPLKEIQGLERTVQAIMKQIYDCTLFLQSYRETGFVGKYLVNIIGMQFTYVL